MLLHNYYWYIFNSDVEILCYWIHVYLHNLAPALWLLIFFITSVCLFFFFFSILLLFIHFQYFDSTWFHTEYPVINQKFELFNKRVWEEIKKIFICKYICSDLTHKIFKMLPITCNNVAKICFDWSILKIKVLQNWIKSWLCDNWNFSRNGLFVHI